MGHFDLPTIGDDGRLPILGVGSNGFPIIDTDAVGRSARQSRITETGLMVGLNNARMQRAVDKLEAFRREAAQKAQDEEDEKEERRERREMRESLGLPRDD